MVGKASGNPGIEGAASNEDTVKAGAPGNPGLEGGAANQDAVEVEAEAVVHHELDDALNNDDDLETVEDFDGLEAAEDFDGLEAVEDFSVAAVGRLEDYVHQIHALLQENAALIDEVKLNLEDATRRAAAAEAAPVLPGTEQEAARSRARQILENARFDVECLVERRWMLLRHLVWLIFHRIAGTRFRFLPAMILAFVPANFIRAYASNDAIFQRIAGTRFRFLLAMSLAFVASDFIRAYASNDAYVALNPFTYGAAAILVAFWFLRRN